MLVISEGECIVISFFGVNRLINTDILKLIVNMLCLTVEIDLDEALSRSSQVTNYLRIVLLW